MADKKVSELSAITNLSGDDLLLVVNDPSGTPTSNKVTLTNLFANVVPEVTFNGEVVNAANVTFSGTTVSVSSNTTFTGTTTFSGIVVENGTRLQNGVLVNNDNAIINGKLTANGNFEVAGRMTIGDTVVFGSNNKLHANNTISANSITNAMLQEVPISNTDARLLIDDRMQVANIIFMKEELEFEISLSRINVYNIDSVGNTAFTFNGPGTSGANNETIYLYRGFRYEFINQNGTEHPFQILNSANGTPFANGVSGSQIGTQFFTVPHAQQSNLVYQCSIHSGMQGTLVIV